MVLSDSTCKDYPGNDSITETYIVFDQGLPIDYFIHVSGPSSQYSAESEYNEEFNVGMDISHFRRLNNELFNNNPYMFP